MNYRRTSLADVRMQQYPVVYLMHLIKVMFPEAVVSCMRLLNIHFILSCYLKKISWLLHSFFTASGYYEGE